jgi:hypothetical protein
LVAADALTAVTPKRTTVTAREALKAAQKGFVLLVVVNICASLLINLFNITAEVAII